MNTTTHFATLTTISCAACGVPFALADSFISALRESGQKFHCPNGHILSYAGEISRLRKELTAAKCDLLRETNQREEAERRAQQEFGRRQRLEKRVRNGVCPCCHRSFTNLRRHMATKHPEKTKTA